MSRSLEGFILMDFMIGEIFYIMHMINLILIILFTDVSSVEMAAL